MASQTLETIIAINAHIGNGFSQVGQTLTELGALVNGTSQELINFGKESVEVYRNYELSMKDAEVALSTTYGKNSKQLKEVMDQLDASATEWAATTIFHTNDVGEAISNAAHAGWDLNKIMTGIPAAMQLAQAGGLDLSEAVDYIVKTTNAAGISFEDLGGFIDLWAFAANSSASTIGEFGDAMLRMGSTMRWAADPEELMTLMAATANAGAVGSEAGTMIRNSIMRLVAPTDKAQKALKTMGATAIESAEILNDENLFAAYQELMNNGFQGAFNDKGELRPILDIYSELAVVLGGMSGGIDKIAENEKAMSILSSIFPTRTITEALNLITAASENYGGLYDKMKAGAAEGYGAYGAETMMDSLHGKIETFESKVERLKQLVGEDLSGQVESVLGGLGNIVDKVATMDGGQFSAIISGLEVLAVAGPGLLFAGGALRFIGTALSWAGGLPVAAIAAAALVAYFNELAEIDYESKFGNMNLDESKVAAYVDGLKQKFVDAQSEVTKFDKALSDSVEGYKTASTDLSQTLITNMLTGVTVEEGSAEYTKLMGLGQDMSDAVRAGIDSRYQSMLAGLTGTFGENGTDDPVWGQIMSLIEQGHQADVAKAEQLSKELRDAMTSAFKDGSLTKDEVANISNIMKQQEELLAQQQDREHYLEKQRMLRKARTLGLEAITNTAAEVTAERDAELETLLERQTADRYDLEHWYDEAIKNGWEVQNLMPNSDGTYGKHKATIHDKEAAIKDLENRQRKEYDSWASGFNDFLYGMYEEGIAESDLAETWGALQTFVKDFQDAGGIVTQNALNKWLASEGHDQVHRYLNSMIDSLGGVDKLQEYQKYFADMGDKDRAAKYQAIIDMYNLLGEMSQAAPEVGGTGENIGAPSTAEAYTIIQSLLKGAYGDNAAITPETLAQWIKGAGGTAVDWQSMLGEDLWSQFNMKAQQAGMSITDWILSGVFPGSQSGNMITTSKGEGGDQLSALISGEEDVVNVMANVEGDATDLHATIMDENGQTLVEGVVGDASQLEALLEKFNGRTVWVNIAGRSFLTYASGGRATEPSIFGEVPGQAEWAIPEAHTERTASLLNAARAASGFTWSELLERYGGLNGTPQNNQMTIVYSPTINAGNADGVERVLKDDKARFEKWYEDRQMREAAEVYS